jgi:hypothetical protein
MRSFKDIYEETIFAYVFEEAGGGNYIIERTTWSLQIILLRLTNERG